MPSLVTTDFIQKERRRMIFFDNGDSGDGDLSFSNKSYHAEVGQEDKEVSKENEKENKQEPNTSHLQLHVLVNGEEISESEASVAEVDEESKTIVPLGRKSENTHHSFPRNIQILPKPSNHLQHSHPKQPSLRMSRKRVSPATSTPLSTRVKEKSTKKPPIKRKKTKLTLTLKPKACLKSKPPNRLPKHLPFPNGEFQAWLLFGDNGGYSIAKDEWTRIRAWVGLKRSKKDFVAETVTFHRIILSLKRDLSLESVRDCWDRVLPSKPADNYPALHPHGARH
jgi:hypothetical protein